MKQRNMHVLLLLAAALPGAGCGNGSADGPGSGGDAKPGMAEARQLYGSFCSTCHGTSGKGDGAGAAALDPKPRSFVDEAWQESVDDEHIEKIILGGGPAAGKSVAMPAQPQLTDQPEVVNGLVEIIRGFGK